MLFKKLKLASIAGVFASVVAAPFASAGLVTYDFSDVDHKWGHSMGNQAHFSSDGLGLSVTAMQKTRRGWKNGGDVWHDGWKWGAKGLGVNSSRHDNWEIDGWGTDEALKFSFDWAVGLSYVKTWFGDRNDDWNMSIKTDNGWKTLFKDNRSSTFGDSDIWTTDFVLWADGSNDSFTVKKVMVEHKMAGVPEPGVIALLAVGLGGLLLQRRAQKS